MYALWGTDLAVALGSAEVLAALEQAGADRVQLNIAGAPEVAGAMTLSTLAPPIDAIVSVWTEAVPEPITAVLAPLTDRVVGWEVTERRPLPPPETWDGSRADAMANVAFLRRPDTLDRTEWLRRWLEDHTPIAIATQATSGYLQNVVERPVTPDVEHVDAIVEELFPLAAAGDIHAFYGSGGDDAELRRRMTALLDSVVRIGAHENIDVVPTVRHLHSLRGATSAAIWP
ncbi:EthD domain-containing protein [Williamsia maris]|uniref:EthD domain-containing protein n=2 Tax=Williamsia maris TaxID=72806 RepID=A0ABT1HH41_9NOCA|nr:EthD domain-containing protein [Williamsia maris]